MFEAIGEIHKTAIVKSGSKLGKNVSVGAYSIIGDDVVIGDNCRIASHVVIDGFTSIGKNNSFFPFSTIGGDPQDRSYKNDKTSIIIGNNNTFRENMTVHRGTLKDKGITTIGDNNYLMTYTHVGHDCIIGNNCTIVNSANIGGHVLISDNVTISGGCNISQFTRIGRGAFIGGASVIVRDVPSFCTGYGNRLKLKGVNIIGMRRLGFKRDEITQVVDFFRTIESGHLSPNSFIKSDELMKDFKNNKIIKEISLFIKNSENGIAPFMSE